mmetsp:Transcript_30592/g.60529  ORF Transcript_30592/g.60529 Transcript_30592/m.60529 type:complete len:208 (-) Transcript_30592:696-1319(-)
MLPFSTSVVFMPRRISVQREARSCREATMNRILSLSAPSEEAVEPASASLARRSSSSVLSWYTDVLDDRDDTRVGAGGFFLGGGGAFLAFLSSPFVLFFCPRRVWCPARLAAGALRTFLSAFLSAADRVFFRLEVTSATDSSSRSSSESTDEAASDPRPRVFFRLDFTAAAAPSSSSSSASASSAACARGSRGLRRFRLGGDAATPK